MTTAWKELLITINGAFLFLILLMASEMAQGQTPEVPSQVRITSVAIEGSGCESTSTAVNFAPDFQSLSVLFSNFELQLGAGTPDPLLAVQTKNCQIRVEMEAPGGWALAIKAVDYRGYAYLPPGASARHRFSYHTPGSPPAMLKEAPIHGPLDQSYFYHLEQPVHQRPFTPCGPPHIKLRLSSHMSLHYPLRQQTLNDHGRETALLSLDSADMSLRQDFQIQWKQCGRKKAFRRQ